jgi:predicted amidohydrolase
MNVLLGEPERNLETVEQMTEEAARRGSDLVLFPELWSTGYDLENADRYATSTDAGIYRKLASLAQAHRIHLLGSTLSLLGPGEYGNTFTWFTPEGEQLDAYSKIHLFQLMDEHHFLSGGAERRLAESPWGSAGLAICYDLRFPELFRAYALVGARMVFLPSEWPRPRLYHWQTLLRARAIENQMFVIACNRVGSSKNTDFFGHSCIIDPWGEVVLEAGEQEMLLTATIDLAQVDEVRAMIPVFADRRPALYS